MDQLRCLECNGPHLTEDCPRWSEPAEPETAEDREARAWSQHPREEREGGEGAGR